jgi:hypothetical protein
VKRRYVKNNSKRTHILNILNVRMFAHVWILATLRKQVQTLEGTATADKCVTAVHTLS